MPETRLVAITRAYERYSFDAALSYDELVEKLAEFNENYDDEDREWEKRLLRAVFGIEPPATDEATA